jgi:hypothetical protein
MVFTPQTSQKSIALNLVFLKIAVWPEIDNWRSGFGDNREAVDGGDQ